MLSRGSCSDGGPNCSGQCGRLRQSGRRRGKALPRQRKPFRVSSAALWACEWRWSYLGGAGVNPSRLRPGSGLGFGLGAFLTSFLPLSLLPMCASVPQRGAWGEGLTEKYPAPIAESSAWIPIRKRISFSVARRFFRWHRDASPEMRARSIDGCPLPTMTGPSSSSCIEQEYYLPSAGVRCSIRVAYQAADASHPKGAEQARRKQGNFARPFIS